MRKLYKDNGPYVTNMHRYYINCEDDLKAAIGDTIVEEDLRLDCHVYGRDEAPKTYPYIVITHADEEYETLQMAFVTLSDFEGV